jgi:hypothetical protein
LPVFFLKMMQNLEDKSGQGQRVRKKKFDINRAHWKKMHNKKGCRKGSLFYFMKGKNFNESWQ